MLMNRGRGLFVAARQNARVARAPCARTFTPLCATPFNVTVRTYASQPASQSLDQVKTYEQKKIEEEINEMIDPDSLPPIEVTAAIARCDGDALKGLGHPSEFVRTSYDRPERCKYCGVRFIRVHGGHHH